MSDTAKPTKVTRPGLRHAHLCLTTEAFFQHIDDCGGWPLDYPYVGFAHSDEREAAFTLEPSNTGWWTTLNHRDDYLMWKISPDGWARIFDSIRRDLANRIANQGALTKGPNVTGWRREQVPLSPDFKPKEPA